MELPRHRVWSWLLVALVIGSVLLASIGFHGDWLVVIPAVVWNALVIWTAWTCLRRERARCLDGSVSRFSPRAPPFL